MSNLLRFGRKIVLPSTREIKHELRMMAAESAVDEAVHDLASDATTPDAIRLLVGDLAAKHLISQDRAAMLVDRVGTTRGLPEGAAQDLRAGKSN